MKILVATTGAADLSAGGFGDGFRSDDEDFFGCKTVGFAD